MRVDGEGRCDDTDRCASSYPVRLIDAIAAAPIGIQGAANCVRLDGCENKDDML